MIIENYGPSCLLSCLLILLAYVLLLIALEYKKTIFFYSIMYSVIISEKQTLDNNLSTCNIYYDDSL